MPEHRYYWETPTEGGWVPKQWEYGADSLDVEGVSTFSERFTRKMMRGMLKADAHESRTVSRRTAMTAVRRYEQARALAASGAPLRPAILIAVADTGLTVKTMSDGPSPLNDASVVIVTFDDVGGRFEAITVLGRTTFLDPARPLLVVDRPDDPIPMWAGRQALAR
ncbi:hypothetical protein [Gordonia humi]|uniref:Uncharacterized protein n=2 Tax=Gordonia humi TaxID=686429 RepID=A0A840EUS8_9ACTN|nr:hypothetical protein [Gordonia humi]MBB4134063.1 hypothetical protein [Gordonia humi]